MTCSSSHGHRDAPGDAGAADADVLEALLDEREGLVVARLRLHEAGCRAEELGQPVLVPAEQEVVVLLLQPDRLDAVVRAEAVGGEVALVPERLAGGAVEAAVAALLDVAGGLELLDEALHERLVLRVGRADEEVVGGAERRGKLAVARRQLVHVLLRREPALLRRLGDLGAVLVRAGEEEHVLAPLAVVAGQHVGGHGRVGVAVVRLAVHVVDGGGDVEAHAGKSTSRRRGLCRTPRPGCGASKADPRDAEDGGAGCRRRPRSPRRQPPTPALRMQSLLPSATMPRAAASLSWTTACRTSRGRVEGIPRAPWTTVRRRISRCHTTCPIPAASVLQGCS